MDNDLKHFGVLGMKWGHRKDESSAGSQKKPLKDILLQKYNSIDPRVKKIGARIAMAGVAYGISYVVAKVVSKRMMKKIGADFVDTDKMSPEQLKKYWNDLQEAQIKAENAAREAWIRTHGSIGKQIS